MADPTDTPDSEPPDDEFDLITDAPFDAALSERYLVYALSTITARSLPDLRDGLKPVHRRLLWTMRQLKLDPPSTFKNSARVVGEVIGKYHPHGDTAAYINCAMDEAQYNAFIDALIGGDKTEFKDWEKDTPYFEGCLPIEEMARRGEDTMRYGPLKPVGLFDTQRYGAFDAPENKEKKPYAVVQLRQEDKGGQLWNMVGFQTNLRWGEQKRVFCMIPGLENAEFIRMGVMHRNTFINSPELLSSGLQFHQRADLFAAGQLEGTEGYTAACAGGWLAGTNAARSVLGLPLVSLPVTTMIGALFGFISSAEPKHFQPMPPNFGIFPALPERIRNKRERYGKYRDRSFCDLHTWAAANQINLKQPILATA